MDSSTKVSIDVFFPEKKTPSPHHSYELPIDTVPETEQQSPAKPEIKPKPILMKKGEKPKTLPKPKIPPKVAPKPNVHFKAQLSDGGTEV